MVIIQGFTTVRQIWIKKMGTKDMKRYEKKRPRPLSLFRGFSWHRFRFLVQYVIYCILCLGSGQH